MIIWTFQLIDMNLEPINRNISETHKEKRSELDKKKRNLDKKIVTSTKKKKSDLDKSFLSITSDQSIEYWLIRNRSNTTWKKKWLFCSEMKCSWKFFIPLDHLYLYELGSQFIDLSIQETKIRRSNHFFWLYFKFNKCWLIIYFIRILWFRVSFPIWSFWISYSKLQLDIFI